MTEDEIEYEAIDNHLLSSSKPSEFSRANCSYVVAPNLFFFSESMNFFTTVHQVTPSFFSFTQYLELYFDFGHISFGPSEVIPLAVSDVRALRNSYISLSCL